MATFTVPNNGFTVGTCGWLAKGLADGSIEIKPGKTKHGKAGLWLHSNGKTGCLALFNEFDLDRSTYSEANKFAPLGQDFCDTFPLTGSCERYLRSAVQEWCDSANDFRNQDIPEAMPKLIITVA